MADNNFIHIASIMEAAMPHVDTRTRITIDLMSKLLALLGCFQNIKNNDLAACGFEDQKIDVEGLLTAIRPLCNGKDLAMVDQILSMFNAKRMFDTYKMYMDAMKTMQGFEGSPFGDFTSDNTESSSDNTSGFDFNAFFSGFANNTDTDSSSDSIQNNTPDSDGDINYSYDSDSELTYDNDDYKEYSTTDTENESQFTYENNSDSDTTDEATGTNADNESQNNMLEMLKAMVPPEQLSTFQNLSMLFNTMSYDNSKSDHK